MNTRSRWRLLLIVGMAYSPINRADAAQPALRCTHDDATIWHYTHWFDATYAPSQAVAVVIHGLNHAPSGMNALIVQLNNMGIDVVRLDLRGHGSNFRSRKDRRQTRLEALERVDAHTWRHEALCAYGVARARAERRGLPLFLVGYSLGGLVGVDLVGSGPERVTFDKMVLLAPALRTRWYTGAVKMLAAWPRLKLKSLAPEEHRAGSSTPIAAFAALFAIQDRVSVLPRSRVNVPTLVLVDPDDELVSGEALRLLIVEHGLHRWSGAWVRKSPSGRSFHHLIVHPYGLGRSAFEQMVARIERHLFGP